MSSSNYRRNKAAIDQFRKELMAMVDDIQQIDKKVLNKTVNNGVAYAKRHTPVGKTSESGDLFRQERARCRDRCQLQSIKSGSRRIPAKKLALNCLQRNQRPE